MTALLDTFKEWRSPESVHTRADWLLFWGAWLLHLPLPVYLVINIVDLNWRNLIGTGLAILISFIPRWMEAHSPYRFPALGEFSISVAMFTELTGRTFRLYEERPDIPFDDFSHAIIVGTLVMFLVLLVYAFFAEHNIDYEGWLVLVIGLLLGMGIGGLWELYEWGADTIVTTSFQHGLTDTMVDLFTGGIGAIVGSVLALLYRRRHTQEELMEELPIFYHWL